MHLPTLTFPYFSKFENIRCCQQNRNFNTPLQKLNINSSFMPKLFIQD